MVQGYNYRNLVCHAVSPQGIIQTSAPIIAVGINCLFKYRLDLTVGDLGLTVYLWMVGGGDSMSHIVYFKQSTYHFVAKMSPSIAIIALGMPYLEKMLTFTKSMTVLASSMRVAFASTHLDT
ncbi:UNVERIFIED_CONTAM: hypothetical protein Slati_0207800 [Sesamum latifolium]|uniref:Uncharacterized protein n=1 Tax=Sesamum latifolium TaxID=2727402 RepID=A0AAW2YBL1_9LAMI